MNQIAIVFDNNDFGITYCDWIFKTVSRNGDFPDNVVSPIITRKFRASKKRQREKKKKLIEEDTIDEDLIHDMMKNKTTKKKEQKKLFIKREK